jgi:uncharacterized coiled-coil protein SlyX
MPECSAWEQRVNHTLGELERRLAEAEAQLEALDASYVRSQGQHESELDRLQRIIERVSEDLTRHQDAHWRSR